MHIYKTIHIYKNSNLIYEKNDNFFVLLIILYKFYYRIIESLPCIIFTIHVPMEWLTVDGTYEELLNYLMNAIDEYHNVHGIYNGLVINVLGIEAALFFDVLARTIWFRRIRIEDDPRPSNIHYYPPLAPPAIEEEWHYGANNSNNNDDDNENKEK